MNNTTESTVSNVKLDILGNLIAPVATASKNSFVSRMLSDEPISFDANQVAAMMAEARIRIEKKAKPYPGVWTWARQNRPEMITKVNEYKLEFVKVTELQNLPACHKWLYAFEQSAKRIVKTYSELNRAIRSTQ